MSQSRNFSAEPPNVTILQMLNGMWLSHAIQAAAYYDFASLIQDERKTTEELSQLTNTQEEWVFRVLRFLAAFGIFAEDAPRTFKNTKLSTYLRDDIPGSMRAMACMMGLKRVREEWEPSNRLCSRELLLFNYSDMEKPIRIWTRIQKKAPYLRQQ